MPAADYKVINENDSKAMVCYTGENPILQTNQFTALYYKGFHTGSEIKKVVEMDINTMVIIPGSAYFAPDEDYNFDKFIYDNNSDTYTCSQQLILTTIVSLYQKSKLRYIHFVKQYKTNT